MFCPLLLIVNCFQCGQSLAVLPQLGRVPVSVLQRRRSPLRLPRGWRRERHVRVLRWPVPVPAQRYRPRLLTVCHRLLGLPQLQT